MTVIDVLGVSKTFGSGRTAVTAVSEVSLHVEPGEVVLIMGPSGSGKSTLLSMIGTLLTPSSGDIQVSGQSVVGMSKRKLSDTRLQQFGFVFQSSNLLGSLTAEQNVNVPMVAAGLSKKEANNRSRALLERFHLSDRLGNLPSQLSGGEKQRVAIARALANDPQVILADEPTASLDSTTGHEVMQLLCDVACDEDRAVIVVSHDPRIEQIAHRVITIEDGRLANERVGQHHVRSARQA